MQPSKRYDDVRFRKYCSDLLKLVEGFLAQEAFDENPINLANFLTQAVKQKKLDKLSRTTVRLARRLSQKSKYRDSEYYYNQYSIEKNYYELAEFDVRRGDKSNIEEIARNLDHFYLAEKLRLYCTVLTRQYQASHEYNIVFMEEIANHLEKHSYETIPPVAIYHQIYLALLHSEDETHYFRLKTLLEEYGLKFPLEEASTIYAYALNYCTRKINKGNQQFLHEYFDLNEDLLKKEILFKDGKLPVWLFNNIAVVALRLQKYEWTEQFIEKYQKRLPEDFRENAVTYNLAQVYFYQKKYTEVIRLLQSVEYEDMQYNLNSKAILLATYYETDEIEPLYSLMESFRTFLNRHKDIPERRRKSYKNLIRFTRKITKVLPNDKEGIQKINKEIGEVKNIASISWLKEKIAELEG